jgi:transposase
MAVSNPTGCAPEVDEEQVKDLHAKIGELAVANGTVALAP